MVLIVLEYLNPCFVSVFNIKYLSPCFIGVDAKSRTSSFQLKEIGAKESECDDIELAYSVLIALTTSKRHISTNMARKGIDSKILGDIAQMSVF